MHIVLFSVVSFFPKYMPLFSSLICVLIPKSRRFVLPLLLLTPPPRLPLNKVSVALTLLYICTPRVCRLASNCKEINNQMNTTFSNKSEISNLLHSLLGVDNNAVR